MQPRVFCSLNQVALVASDCKSLGVLRGARDPHDFERFRQERVRFRHRMGMRDGPADAAAAAVRTPQDRCTMVNPTVATESQNSEKASPYVR